MKNLDADRIDQYLRKELSPEEMTAFEADIQENEELAQEVELRRVLIAGIHHHHREKIRAIFEEEEAKFTSLSDETNTNTDERIRYLRPLSFIIAAAAIVLILVLLRPILLPPPDASPEEMFNQFAMHYSGGDLIKRDVDTCLTISDAITTYDQQNYASAIPKFQALLADSESLQACKITSKDLQLLLGISYVFEGQIEQGRSLLGELSNEMETANWYLLLSYVKEGNWEEVKSRISQWDNPSNYYEKRILMLENSLP